MRTSIIRRSLRAIAALSLLGVFGQAAAQEDTTRFLVQVIQLKNDMIDEWRELQEDEIVPALREAGVPTRTVLETILGDRPEYVTIRPLDSFAEFDGPGILQSALGEREAEELIARLNSYQISSQRYIATRLNEFDLGARTGPVRLTTWYRVNPGAGPLYRAFLRDEAVPVMLQAIERGLINGWSVSTLGQGAPEADLWSISTYLPNHAMLDEAGAINQILGDAGAQALAARAVQLRTAVRTMVRRSVPELGY